MKNNRVSSYVNPSIGVDGWGGCLIGPYLPFSLVRLGPDTTSPHYTNGYQSNQPIIRFSHTHVSGTGGGGRYGNIGVTPFTGPAEFPPVGLGYERAEEVAEPGYYRVAFQEVGIIAELTVTPRVGIHRYTFLKNESEANILLDVGAVIQTAHATPGLDTGLSTGGWVEFISATEVIGRGDFRGGWGHSFPYSVYFYARFDQPMITRMVANQAGPVPALATDGPKCRAVAGFGVVPVVNLQVGISFVSIAKAQTSVEQEVAKATFEQVRDRASQVWEEALARIQIVGDDTQKTLFYTLFTRLLCMPTDLGVDDENPFWQSGVRQFSDFYCLWDSVRNANSLLTLFAPNLEVSFLNALLDVAEHRGWLPDAWISGHSAEIQGGSSADILLCEAALKGLQGIDYEKALMQMRKNNEIEPPDPVYYGRYLTDYHELGYVSTRVVKSCVSRHLEYTYQDWCIGKLAEKLGQTEIAQQYLESSKKVWHLWRDDLRSFAPRNPDGSWVSTFEPDQRLAERWLDPYFYEGTGRQWSFNVQHDFSGLIQRHGGNEKFVEWLDQFFEEGYYEHKETMLHIPYLYIYAGRPDKTAERVRECITKYYQTSRDGLSDNEDMGCQSAWYMWSALGLYPVMGQTLYLITTPLLSRSEISLGPSGKKLIIETSLSSSVSSGKSYITKGFLNGQPLERAWLTHQEIVKGATLQLETGTFPNGWGSKLLPIPQ